MNQKCTSAAHFFLFLVLRASCNWSISLSHPKKCLHRGITGTNPTAVRFNADRAYLFLLEGGLAVWSELWSGGGFTPVILVQNKQKVWKSRTNDVGMKKPSVITINTIHWTNTNSFSSLWSFVTFVYDTFIVGILMSNGNVQFTILLLGWPALSLFHAIFHAIVFIPVILPPLMFI